MNQAIAPRSPYRLAPIQRYLVERCLSGRLEPGCYHTQFSYHLRVAGLVLPLFFKALTQVAARHPVVRTTLSTMPDGTIGQRLDAAPAPRVRFDDISTQAPDEQERWIRQLLLDDRARPFTLVGGAEALARFYLVKRGADTLQFILVFHHAIWDGWSLAVFMKEVLAHYVTLRRSPTAALAPAAYDYADFIDDDAAVRQQDQGARFWAAHLRRPYNGHTPVLSAGAGAAYEPVQARLPDELVARLEDTARRCKVPLRTLFVAATLALARDVAPAADPAATIGIVSNGRSIRLRHPLTTLGLLWNMAPLCVDMGEASAPLDRQLRQVQTGLDDTSHFTSHALLDLLAQAGRDELFDVSFNYIDFGGANILPPGAGIDFLETGGFDKFHYPLNILVGRSPFDRAITVVLNHDSRRFTSAQAQEHLRRFVGWLDDAG